MNKPVCASGAVLAVVLVSSACSSESPRVVLTGHDLGVVEIGASFDGAVGKITDDLGAPMADPAPGTACPGSTREVLWRGLRIGEQDGLLIGWVSTSGELATGQGVRVGSTQADLEKAYGDDLALVPATAGVGRSFSVASAALAGNIDPSGTVSALFSGGCGT